MMYNIIKLFLMKGDKSMNMKKLLKIFVAAVMLVAVFGAVNVMAADEIEVYVNDAQIEFDVAPQIINDRTMIPFRYVANAFGAEVDYKEEADGTKIVTAVQGDKTLILTIGSTDATLIENGTETVLTFDVAPIIIESRTLVPVRLVGEAFGCSVGWNGDEKQVIIIDPIAIADSIKEISPEFYNEVLNLDFTDFSGYYNIYLSVSELGTEDGTTISLAVDDEAVQLSFGYEGGQADIIATANELYMQDADTKGKWHKMPYSEDIAGLEFDASELVIDAEEIVRTIAVIHMNSAIPTTDTYAQIKSVIDALMSGIDNEESFIITEDGDTKSVTYSTMYTLGNDSLEFKIFKKHDSDTLKALEFSAKSMSGTEEPSLLGSFSILIEREDAAADVEIIIPSADDIITE